MNEENESPLMAPPVMAPPPQPQLAPEPVDGNRDPLRFVAPIHASGMAVAAGYLGLFSVLLIFAPFALVTGIFALRDLKANPTKTGKGRAYFGIGMGGAFSLVLVYVLFQLVT
jgi:hypothetical protein